MFQSPFLCDTNESMKQHEPIEFEWVVVIMDGIQYFYIISKHNIENTILLQKRCYVFLVYMRHVL